MVSKLRIIWKQTVAELEPEPEPEPEAEIATPPEQERGEELAAVAAAQAGRLEEWVAAEIKLAGEKVEKSSAATAKASEEGLLGPSDDDCDFFGDIVESGSEDGCNVERQAQPSGTPPEADAAGHVRVRGHIIGHARNNM